MTDPLTQTSLAGKPQPEAHAGEPVHDHDHAHDHSHDREHGHSRKHPDAPAGHAEHIHSGASVHVHRAHAAPAVAPAAHMAWSVLSLSVFQRLLLVVPMLVCLWLAVVWAIAG